MKHLVLFAGVVLAAGSAAAQDGSRAKGIVGSAHDFSGYTWASRQICLPCHTPHDAMPSLPRLWNHQLTEATYQMHAGSGNAAEDFDTVSRMCLSCHDGTVALDNFGGFTGGRNFIRRRFNMGTDLRNDHPIGSDAVYPPENPPPWWNSEFRDPPNYDLELKPWTNKDSGNVVAVVSCATCHEVHNATGNPHMLVRLNSASQLCLACHIK